MCPLPTSMFVTLACRCGGHYDSVPLALVIDPKAHPQQLWFIKSSGTYVSTPLFSLCDLWDWLSKYFWIWLFFSKRTHGNKTLPYTNFSVTFDKIRAEILWLNGQKLESSDSNRSTGSTFHLLSFMLMSSS